MAPSESCLSKPLLLSIAASDGQLDGAYDVETWQEAHAIIERTFALQGEDLPLSVHLVAAFDDLGEAANFQPRWPGQQWWHDAFRVTMHTLWYPAIFEAQAETPEVLALYVECFGIGENADPQPAAEVLGPDGMLAG
jgi:hypothetical protein